LEAKVFNGINPSFFCIAVNVGSCFEQKKNNGISHLIEHVVMADSRVKRIAQSCHVDAITTKEWTYYLIVDNVPGELYSKLEDFISGIFDSELLSDVVAIEKRIVISELSERSTFSQYYQIINLHMHNGSTYSLPTGGEPEAIYHISTKELRQYYQESYLNGRRIGIYCSDPKLKEMGVEIIEKYIYLSKPFNKPHGGFMPSSLHSIIDSKQTTLVLANLAFSPDKTTKEKMYLLMDYFTGKDGLLQEAVRTRFFLYFFEQICSVYDNHILIGVGTRIKNESVNDYLTILKHTIDRVICSKDMIVDALNNRKKIYIINKSCNIVNLMERIRWENEINSSLTENDEFIDINDEEAKLIQACFDVSLWKTVVFSNQEIIKGLKME